MDARGRKMTRITIHVKHFTEAKSWKALDLTIGFRYEEGVDVVAVIKMDRFQMMVRLRSKWKIEKVSLVKKKRGRCRRVGRHRREGKKRSSHGETGACLSSGKRPVEV